MLNASEDLQGSLSSCCAKGKEWAESSGGNGLAMGGGADCDAFPPEYEEAVEIKYRVRDEAHNKQ